MRQGVFSVRSPSPLSPNSHPFQVLLSNGANPSVQSHHDGDTPLHKVKPQSYSSRSLCSSSSPPLLQSVREGHLDIVQLLLSHGADPAVINAAGEL
jgi:ankyrin repeat protein